MNGTMTIVPYAGKFCDSQATGKWSFSTFMSEIASKQHSRGAAVSSQTRYPSSRNDPVELMEAMEAFINSLFDHTKRSTVRLSKRKHKETHFNASQPSKPATSNRTSSLG